MIECTIIQCNGVSQVLEFLLWQVKIRDIFGQNLIDCCILWIDIMLRPQNVTKLDFWRKWEQFLFLSFLYTKSSLSFWRLYDFLKFNDTILVIKSWPPWKLAPFIFRYLEFLLFREPQKESRNTVKNHDLYLRKAGHQAGWRTSKCEL